VVGHQTEEEQIEAIKRWWERNGKFVILGVIVVIASVVGTRAWQNFELTNSGKVSAQYDLMMKEIEDDRIDSAIQRGKDIIDNNSEMMYATLAALAIAKLHINTSEYEQAVERLKWALNKTTTGELQHIIRLRLARALLAAGQLNEALSYANFPQPDKFSAQYAVVKGDIYYKKGELASAQTAYKSAIDDKELGSQLRTFVQTKLDDLGSTLTAEATQ